MKRKLRRLHKRIKRHVKNVKPKHVGIVAVCIVLAVLLFLLIAIPSTMYELTDVDVLSIPNLHASQISVKGVALGDSLEFVIEKLGYPDSQQIFPPNIVNVEFGEKLGLSGTGIIVHVVDDKVTRITLKKPFNEFLVGKTKIGASKTKLFSLLGTPDSIEKVPVTQGSAFLMRVYTYKESSLQIVIHKQNQNALSFFS